MELQNRMDTNIKKQRANKVLLNMILLLSGRLISLFGSQIYNFAISLYVLRTTGSSTAFSITLVFGMLPRIILGPVAGVISDKVDRKKLVVLMDIASGLLIFGLAAMASLDSLRLSYIYITNLLLNTFNTFFDVPMSASMPNIVDDENLVKLNSLNNAVSSMAQIAGPFLGGLVFAFIDMRLFLIINAASFIISGISEMFIDFNFNKKLEEIKADESQNKMGIKNFIEQFKEGTNFIRSKKVLAILFSFSLLLNFFLSLGVTVPYPYIINNVIKMSSTRFGILEAMLPLGMMVGAIVMSILPEKERKYRLLVVGIMFISIITALIGIPVVPKFMIFSSTIYFIFYIICLFIAGFAIVYTNIPVSVILQRETPDNIRGRIFGLLQTLCMGISPVGLILSGLIIEKIPVYVLPVLSGIIMIFLALRIASNSEIKKI